MNTNARRDELLSTITLDPIRHQVVDELERLEEPFPLVWDDVKSLALVYRQLPALLDIRKRGQAHAGEVRRLIGLIHRENDQVQAWIDVANALTILTNASNLALLLLPVRTDDDAWARDDFARNLLRLARRNGDGEDIALAHRAVGEVSWAPADLTAPANANAIRAMIETLARRAAALRPGPLAPNEAGELGIFALEQAESLKAYFAAKPDLGDLLDSAAALLELVDDLRKIQKLDPDVSDAIEGGLILAYARLLRVALWPARDTADVAAKIAARDLVRSRTADLDRFGAVWEIAFDQGETIAGQSSQFLSVAADG